MENDDARLNEIFQKASQNPLARGLPVDAFILAPVQRLARYPMLVQAIASRTNSGSADSTALEEALATFSESVRLCNARLRGLEDHALLQKIASQMDFSRIDQPPPLVKRWVRQRGLFERK